MRPAPHTPLRRRVRSEFPELPDELPVIIHTFLGVAEDLSAVVCGHLKMVAECRDKAAAPAGVCGIVDAQPAFVVEYLGACKQPALANDADLPVMRSTVVGVTAAWPAHLQRSAPTGRPDETGDIVDILVLL